MTFMQLPLEACEHGQTQNTNEGLHLQIWSVCPKTKFISHVCVEASAATAISHFNMETSVLAWTLKHMGLSMRQSFEKQSTS